MTTFKPTDEAKTVEINVKGEISRDIKPEIFCLMIARQFDDHAFIKSGMHGHSIAFRHEAQNIWFDVTYTTTEEGGIFGPHVDLKLDFSCRTFRADFFAEIIPDLAKAFAQKLPISMGLWRINDFIESF